MKLVSGSLLITLASTAAIAAAPPSAPAPAPAAQVAPAVDAGERLELARKFVSITVTEDRFAGFMRVFAMQGVMDSQADDLDGGSPEAVRAKFGTEVDKMVARFMAPVHAKMPILKEAYAHAYAREFSADELRTMTTFAESSAGHHYLSNQAFAMEDPAVVAANAEIQQSMEPVLEGLRREACAKKAAARVAAGDKKATCPLAKAAETAQG